MRTLHPWPPPRRSGVILLVVVVLLALFAVIGLSFVLYAESEATASRIYRESQLGYDDRADVPPELLLSWALGDLIYDVKDDEASVNSALRGHSLARSMFGWNYTQLADGTISAPSNNNTVPFNGVGVLRNQAVPGPLASAGLTDDYNLVNYMYFQNDGFLRDPERLGARSAPTQTLGQFAGGINAPYTYPDRNNMYLAALRPRDGEILVPSFFRPNTPFGSLAPNNGNWLNRSNPALKYMVLRPRPADMYYNFNDANDPKNFPLPADPGGDVKNLQGGPGGMDSIWLDLNFDVQVTRSGKKFKPLFAFLVVDLDNRININTHGNIRSGAAGNQQHASFLGIGPQEVNVSKVLSAGSNEWRNLFTGRVSSHYGQTFTSPAGTTPALPPGMRNSFLLPMDFDGVDEANANKPMTTRFQSTLANFRAFPDFTTLSGYGNFSANERLGHPSQYSVLRWAGNNAPFTDNNVFWLARDYNTSGNEYQKSQLWLDNILTNNLGFPGVRQMLTTRSFDLDVAGATPWIVNPSDPAGMLKLAANFDPNQPGTWIPQGGATTYPSSGGRPAPPPSPPPGSQFAADGRGVSYGKLNLNRPLAPYYNSSNQFDPAQADIAIRERQAFAADILDRLILATGAVPLAQLGSAQPEQVNAVRYLAQLAVNIVDYIDDDDFITPFNWRPGSPTDIVHGTEAPKLVVNEAYVEVRNDPNDPGPMNPLIQGATMPFKMHFWFELFNPLPRANGVDPTTNQDRAATQLYRTDPSSPTPIPIYQIVIAKQKPGFAPRDLRTPNNTSGDPQAVTNLEIVAQVGPIMPATPSPTTEWVQPQTTPAANSPPGQNQGFYVLAPNADFEGGGGSFQPTAKHQDQPPSGGPPNALTVDVPLPSTKGSPLNKSEYQHTILLRRLACPQLPPQPNPAQPRFNPYVTIDYLCNVPLNDAAQVVEQSSPQLPPPRATNPNYQTVTQRRTYARPQPYVANQAAPTTSGAPGGGSEPVNTFFYHNNQSSPQPYDWLVHLDRPVTSPLELLYVSGFKPHELTQQFQYQVNKKNSHVAPWMATTDGPFTQPQQVENARLFRALAWFTAGDRGTPAATGGRVPGRININTLWGRPSDSTHEVLEALCDAQSNSTFTATDVQQVWTRLKQRRSATLGGTGGQDRPIWSLAAPVAQSGSDAQYPVGIGIGDTIVGGLFQQQASGPGQHPRNLDDLLLKVANNLTTRSNVFAVYLTVGFFEVMDDSTRPIKLGAEIKYSGRPPIRHRMFAIVDRTKIGIESPNGAARLRQADQTPFFFSSRTAVAQNSSNAQIELDGPIDTYEGATTTIVPGMTLYADLGTHMEPVQVTAVNTSNPSRPILTINQFTRPHASGFTLSNIMVGNPGPQGPINYTDPRYSSVVPFTYIIE